MGNKYRKRVQLLLAQIAGIYEGYHMLTPCVSWRLRCIEYHACSHGRRHLQYVAVHLYDEVVNAMNLEYSRKGATPVFHYLKGIADYGC